MLLSTKEPGEYILTLSNLRSAPGCWIAKFDGGVEAVIAVDAVSFATALGYVGSHEGVTEALDEICRWPGLVRNVQVRAHVHDKSSRFGSTYRIVSWSAVSEG